MEAEDIRPESGKGSADLNKLKKNSEASDSDVFDAIMNLKPQQTGGNDLGNNGKKLEQLIKFNTNFNKVKLPSIVESTDRPAGLSK